MSHGKVMIVHLIAGLRKTTQLNKCDFSCTKMSPYFPKQDEPFGRDINVKVDLPNCATKIDKKIFRILILQVSH